jgi:membrane fusion protein, protease secretion system
MKLIPFIKHLKSLSSHDIDIIEGEVVSDLSSLDAEHEVDTKDPIRLGIWILLIGFGGFLLWAGFAPLDEGVPSNGSVSIDTKRKVVQHLTGGIVKEIRVKEGQLVKEGQILLTLDNSMAKAKFQEIQQRYIGDRAIENRLQA